ncbi:hypothetical protein BDU57DRAFT_565202 [Ampelomyces quisqualis]|uniref:Uncharacterized protein n=1 Tax=Ampelomyces quisqualis TaxID=50730 RepID=A0A6A5Q8P9_AMPQU|nr:hypothetical protein BDU57DRAFT_565202 [Ampelomyces quisqualis]
MLCHSTTNMSELTLAAVENALKKATRAVGACLSTIGGMSNASPDVKDMSSRLEALDTCLRSLNVLVTLQCRKQEFLDAWSEPTKSVLVALRDILAQMQERLGKRPAKLRFWSKPAWPFEGHETPVLRMHLGAYTSLVELVFNSYRRTSIPAVQLLSNQLEETKSRFGQLNLSNIDRPAESSVESTSGKQLQDTNLPQSNDHGILSAPVEWTTWNEQIFKVISFRRKSNLSYSLEAEDLGPGTVVIRYARNGSGLWVFFCPEATETLECRWYSKVCEQWAEMNREQDHRLRIHRWNNYKKKSIPAISLMMGMADYVPDTPPEYGRIFSGVNTLLLQFTSQRQVEACWEAFCEMWEQCGRNWERQIRMLKEEQRQREAAGLEHEEELPRAGNKEQEQRVEDEELPAYSPAIMKTGEVDDA